MVIGSRPPWVLLGLAASLALAAPALGLEGGTGVRRFVLAGGLVVLAGEDRRSPVAAVDVAVAAGSAQEPTPGLAAAAAAMAAAPLPAAAARLGGTFTREVGREAVHFALALPAPRLAEGLEALGAALAHPAPEAFAPTLATILDEQRAFMAQPRRALRERLLALLLPWAGAGHPPFGTPASLARLRAEDALAFIEQRYLGDRVRVAVVGDVPLGRVAGMVLNAFGALLKRREGPPPALEAGSAEPLDLAPPLGQALAAAGVPGPSAREIREQAAMELAASLLALGRLRAELGGLATEASAEWLMLRGPGVLVAEAAGPAGAALAPRLRAALRGLAERPLGLDEFARAQRDAGARLARRQRELPARAAYLSGLAVLSPAWAPTYADVAQELSRQQEEELLRRLLSPRAIEAVSL